MNSLSGITLRDRLTATSKWVAESPRFQRQEQLTIWENEYKNNPTIPSSHRRAPAHALENLFNCHPIQAEEALDLGCGNGRNAAYLSSKGMKVTALDFSSSALKLAKSYCGTQVEFLQHDLYQNLPFKDESFDLVLDSYCLCHFVELDAFQHAMNQCYRALKPGGYFVNIHLDRFDVYYQQRVEALTEFGHISYDKTNRLRKLHFDKSSYKQVLSPGFTEITTQSIKFIDSVRGQDYERSVFAGLYRKNQKL